MTQNTSGTGNYGIFARLIESSRKALGQKQAATKEELTSLSFLIENEIIPRLQMTFPSPLTSTEISPETDSSARPEYDCDGFVAALLSRSPDDAKIYVDDLRKSEHSLLEIYKNLLTPAAQMLGEMWEDDRCTFADVTIAITKIRHLFVATAPLFPVSRADDDGSAPSILLTTVPGEQHTFGLYYAVEMFRTAGWTVWSGTPRTTRELNELVAREKYDATGLSVSASRNLPVVAQAILDVRNHSVNPDMLIILGGQLAMDNKTTVDDFKVDMIARDMDSITEDAADLVKRQRSEPL